MLDKLTQYDTKGEMEQSTKITPLAMSDDYQAMEWNIVSFHLLLTAGEWKLIYRPLTILFSFRQMYHCFISRQIHWVSSGSK